MGKKIANCFRILREDRERSEHMDKWHDVCLNGVQTNTMFIYKFDVVKQKRSCIKQQ